MVAAQMERGSGPRAGFAWHSAVAGGHGHNHAAHAHHGATDLFRIMDEIAKTKDAKYRVQTSDPCYQFDWTDGESLKRMFQSHKWIYSGLIHLDNDTVLYYRQYREHRGDSFVGCKVIINRKQTRQGQTMTVSAEPLTEEEHGWALSHIDQTIRRERRPLINEYERYDRR